MKAAVFLSRECMEFRELPVPEPVPGEVLVKVLGCGVCGTDAHIYSGEIQNARPPVIIGHEIFGEIEKLGEEAGGFQIGDRVVVDPFIYCGQCAFCMSGNYRFCENETFIGYHRAGGFAQYTTVPITNAYRVPTSLGYEDGVLAETLATVVAGFSRLNPQAGSSFLLLGAGTVGLLWNQLLRRSLSISLIQTEIIGSRIARAQKMGADLVLSPQEKDLSREVKRLCPLGVDYVIDATGSTEAIQQALPLLKRGGTLMSFGICPEEERLELSMNWFYQQQVTFMTSRRPPREMERALKLLDKGIVSAKEVVTGRYPLEEIEHTFELFANAKDREIKMAIDPWM